MIRDDGLKEAVPVRLRGRPSGSDGLTEERILAAARECFAEAGYVGTTTSAVAARADLTTGALYHYFTSKRELYLAAVRQVEAVLYGRLAAATADLSTLRDRVEAIFTEIVRMTRSDPTTIRFINTVTVDLARHAELQEVVSIWAQRDKFFRELVQATELEQATPAETRVAVETITTMMVGLVAISELVPKAQARALEGYTSLFDGTFFRHEHAPTTAN
jgi:AcrR family transcriptional regulator